MAGEQHNTHPVNRVRLTLGQNGKQGEIKNLGEANAAAASELAAQEAKSS